MADDEAIISLATFQETDPKCVVNSPRSLQACKSEGVLPLELTYKPVEAFQEKNLSPRLVKLRYDFFEAKRRDLLAATRRARDTLVAEEKREREVHSQQVDALAKQTGLGQGAILALHSDNLALERRKFQRSQERERTWLKNALNNELRSLQKLENANIALSEEADTEAEKARQTSIRLKEINDKRREDEDRKVMEMEARQKLEKQIAKEEFHKQLEEIQRKKELEAKKQQEAYQRQLKEMEKKKEAEREKERKREAEAAAQEARKEEMRANDLKRKEVMEQQHQSWQEAMEQKKEQRDLRIIASVEANQELERQRRADFEERQRMESIREERLAQDRAVQQEESAKKSFQLMMKRKYIQDESNRKLEERRNAILEELEESEQRLLEHEQKKERYLDFKRELDGLRGRNKEINVERQRRREEAYREDVAEQVRKKDEKIEWMASERNRIRSLRRAAQTEGYRCREIVKGEIMRQRIASQFDSKALQKKMEQLMSHDLFGPQALKSSMSMPALVK